MDTPHISRALTHDEQKAAEAAFGGRPFNPAWSASAKKVYDGLIQALPKLPEESEVLSSKSKDTVEPVNTNQPPAVDKTFTEVTDSGKSRERSAEQTEESADKAGSNREEAIKAGFLIDVTADAKKLGLTFSVTITKPLWEIGIAPTVALSDEEKSERLRDVLMAFRLRMAGQGTLSPLIDFPALLALPPGSVPQPVPLFALIQPDEQNRTTVTLLLPNEVSATIIPLN